MTRFRTQMLAFPFLMSGVLAAPVAQAAQASGETVYGKYCTTCHDATDGRAPTRAGACKTWAGNRLERGEQALADFATQRLNMVESQVRPSDVTDRRLMRVLLDLPREVFLPAASRSVAYADEDVPASRGEGGRVARYLLAPRILAKLIQAAEIVETDRVLDVGCATGYSTAVLARLAARVIGLEEQAELVAQARDALATTKTEVATVQQGPLAHGWPGEAPFDVIVLNGSVPEVSPQLLSQLKDLGRLVAIVAPEGTFGAAHVFTKRGNAVAARIAFDAGAPRLPGFERIAGFAF